MVIWNNNATFNPSGDQCYNNVERDWQERQDTGKKAEAKIGVHQENVVFILFLFFSVFKDIEERVQIYPNVDNRKISPSGTQLCNSNPQMSLQIVW